MFADMQAKKKREPDTTYLPEKRELDMVHVGSHVHVQLKYEPIRVKVTGMEDGKIQGFVDMHPIAKKLNHRDEVEFEMRHIANVCGGSFQHM